MSSIQTYLNEFNRPWRYVVVTSKSMTEPEIVIFREKEAKMQNFAI